MITTNGNSPKADFGSMTTFDSMTSFPRGKSKLPPHCPVLFKIPKKPASMLPECKHDQNKAQAFPFLFLPTHVLGNETTPSAYRPFSSVQFVNATLHLEVFFNCARVGLGSSRHSCSIGWNLVPLFGGCRPSSTLKLVHGPLECAYVCLELHVSDTLS